MPEGAAVGCSGDRSTDGLVYEPTERWQGVALRSLLAPVTVVADR